MPAVDPSAAPAGTLPPIGHEMVRASAGTGKTTSLTWRYVRLLAMGAKPESIVALTFTRKAAGEFFDRIAELLAAASAGAAAAAELSEKIGLDPSLDPNYPRLLRDLLSKQHQLMLGTLDSFYARVVRSFPFELGVTGGFQILSGHELDVGRSRSLAALFSQVGETKEKGLKYFLEAFKQATHGMEEVRLGNLLDDYIGRYHRILLDSPEGLRWGDESMIWGAGGQPYKASDEAELTERKAAFVKALESDGEISKETQLTKWEETLDHLIVRPPGTALNAGTFLENNVLPNMEAIRSGNAVITVARKKCGLDAMQCQALCAFIDGVLGADLRVRLRRAEGVQRLLRDFERIYHAGVRARGAMTFDDLARLLGDISRARHGGELQQISLDMAYRLDSSFDHWLLDEFQDTSRVQWAALEDLVDEAVQDDSDERSLFIVGDTKQAIYGWREGDSRLFDEVLARYNQGGEPRIKEGALDRSFRSAKPVIDAVNLVFGDRAAMGELFQERAVERWRWHEHSTADKIADRAGYVELLESCPEGLTGASKDKGSREAARLAMVAERLAEIRPAERGLTCAVLVQDNKVADRALDFLREHCPGQEFSSESSRLIAHENMLCSALYSLLRVAVYPGERLAWRHLEMTPLLSLLARLGLDGPGDVSGHILRGLEARGFAKTLRWWLDEMEGDGMLDGFARVRAGQLVEAGAAFDRRGGTDPADFLDVLEKYEISDASGGSAVQIMTVHKSKGLDFDLVFLPDLDGDVLGVRDRSGNLLVGRGDRREICWAIEAPAGKLLGIDPVLAGQKEASVIDEVYEGFCRLYVGMTRPKHGLYLIVDQLSKSGSVRGNFAGWLRTTLAPAGGEPVETTLGASPCRILYRSGDAEWHEGMAPREEQTVVAVIPRAWPQPREGGVAPGAALPPSPAEDRPADTVAAVQAVDLEGVHEAAMERGTQIHALMESVGWLGDEVGEIDLTAGASSEIAEEVSACLANEEVRALMGRPSGSGGHEIWKERAFDVVVEGRWLSGVIDRAQIHRDESGRIRRVEVIDFKSDRVDARSMEAAVEQHSVQLKRYQDAVCALLGLPADRVGCHLVFTNTGTVREVA